MDQCEGEPIQLTAGAMRRYEGVYAWGSEPLRVRVEGKVIRVSAIQVLDRTDLVPMVGHELVQGLYRIE